MEEDSSYVKRIPPPPLPGHRGMDVEVALLLQQVVDLSEIESTVTLQFELGLRWVDRGLTFLNLRRGDGDGGGGGGGVNRLSEKDKDIIWQPKVLIVMMLL